MDLSGRHLKVVNDGTDLTLTYGRDTKGQKLAIISKGGHPQIPNSGECVLLDVEVCKTLSDAKKWFRQQKITRPWETRQ